MSDEKIRTAIRKIAGNGSTQAHVAEVVSIDTNNRTATVQANGIDYIVQMAPATGDQLLQIPEIGSTVFIVDGIIVGYSDLSELWLRGNQFGGLVKVSDLVTKLNNLEDKVNSLLAAYNAHTHASSGAPPVPTVTGSLTPTTQNDIENPLVKHG
jgi:hypothetical protein